MKNLFTLLLSIAMVATGYYFWQGKKTVSTVTNIHIKFNKDSAMQMVEIANRTIDSSVRFVGIENQEFTHKTVDTITAIYLIKGTKVVGKIGSTNAAIAFNKLEYWKFYYANGKWNSDRSMTPW
jgi:hypothetical protein